MIGPLKNLFGGKKETFFLEFDEAEGTSTAPETPAASAPVAEAPQPTEQTATKAEAKKPAKKKSIKKKAAAKAQAPAAAAPVAATTAPAAPPKPAVLFAPDNLAPQPSGNRRRPGPSLNSFKDMAKTMGRR